ERLGMRVAVGVVEVAAAAEVLPGPGVVGGDDVPAGPAAGEQVEGLQATGAVDGGVVGGVLGGAQADVLGDAGERREQGLCSGPTGHVQLEGDPAVLPQPQPLPEEERGELPALGGADQRLEGLPRHLVAAGGQAPDGRGVHALEERAEGELPGGGVRRVERMLGGTGREGGGLRGQRCFGHPRVGSGGGGGGGGHAVSSRVRRARSARRAGSRWKGAGARPSWARRARRGAGVGERRSRARSSVASWPTVPSGSASRSRPTSRTSRTLSPLPVGPSSSASVIQAASCSVRAPPETSRSSTRPSAVSAATWAPTAARSVSATSTGGRPCGERGVIAGPRTEKVSASTSAYCSREASTYTPRSTSRTTASGAQESHTRRTAASTSAASRAVASRPSTSRPTAAAADGSVSACSSQPALPWLRWSRLISCVARWNGST